MRTGGEPVGRHARPVGDGRGASPGPGLRTAGPGADGALDYCFPPATNRFFAIWTKTRRPTSAAWSSPPTFFIFYFLPVFLLVYFNLPYRWRNLWITVASYVFYGWWQPWFVCLMMFTTVMDFIWGLVITRPGATRAQRKAAVVACVVTNLGFLGFFKYYMFAADTLNPAPGPGWRRAVPGAAGRAADRHLLLHVPFPDLHH